MAEQESQLVLNPRLPNDFWLLDEEGIVQHCQTMKADLYNLFIFGELDMNYQRIIGEHIISKRTLNMSEISKHYPVRDVFRHYGEFITELSIKESDIQYKSGDYTYAEEIFRLIKKRCVAGKLESVTIYFDGKPKDVNANVFLDVFSELKSLTIIKPEQGKWDSGRDKPLQELLEKLLANCTNLQSLQLQKMCGFGEDFLLIPPIRSLQSLFLNQCWMAHESWLKFVKAGVRPLKALNICHAAFRSHEPEGVLQLNHGEFLQQIVESFPHLETFVFINDDWLNRFINPNYESIGRLPQLKAVSIYSHYYDSRNSNWLSLLANPHLVEEFAVELPESFESPIAISAFTNLRSVEFFNPILSHLSVYTSFVALPQLTECVFGKVDRNYHSFDMDLIVLAVVMTSGRLQTLKVLIDRVTFTASIYNDLVKKRERLFPNASPLRLYANFPMSGDNIGMYRHKKNVIEVFPVRKLK